MPHSRWIVVGPDRLANTADDAAAAFDVVVSALALGHVREFAAALGEAARLTYEAKFRLEHLIERTEALYQSLVEP